MISLTLITQALDPSFSSFKTQRGWRFLHYSQALLLVYCQDFTMVLLVWPSLASPSRTDLSLGRGVTDAQLYTSIQPPSACLTAFSCIMDSSVSMRNPEQSRKYLFLPWRPLYRMCPDIHSGNKAHCRNMWKRFECPDLTLLSSEEACAQAPIDTIS